MKSLRTLPDGVGNQPLIEGGELPSVYTRECEEIAIAHLRGIEKATAIDHFGIQETDVVSPEMMARQCTEHGQQL
jgi:hypothetical protein